MHSAVLKVLGILLVLFSTAMLLSALVALLTGDGAIWQFILSWAITAGSGALLWWLAARGRPTELKLRDGFTIVVLFWVLIGLYGAVPLLIVDQPRLSFTDATFESFSGITTTGATVLKGLDTLPTSVLFYRQLLQWLGGMGIIVLAVAVLPMLGIGGMQLYRAESPGPSKESKLTPRITETAKSLWQIYLFLTITCALCYYLAGMGAFDALTHAFSTVSIGGFSTYDAGFSYFQGDGVKFVCTVFMLISGVNFALHFIAVRTRSPVQYLRDPEFNAYLLLHATIILSCVLYLYQQGHDYGLIDIVFQAVSYATTTGFSVAGFEEWPEFIAVGLLLASFGGACAGSVGGGIKLIRFQLLFKQGRREIIRLIHPNAAIYIKMGSHTLGSNVIDAVWGFFSAYVLVFIVLMLLLVAIGLDQVTAFSAVAACMNNLGPGLGEVAGGYGALSAPAKWTLITAMVFGRLEIFTILALLTITFWRE